MKFKCGDEVETNDGHLKGFRITEIHVHPHGNIFYDLESIRDIHDKYNRDKQYEYKGIQEWILVKKAWKPPKES